MVVPGMLVAGAMMAPRVLDEVRYLRDYKKRYPHVKIKYPGRTSMYRSFSSFAGTAVGAYYGSRGYDRVRRMYR